MGSGAAAGTLPKWPAAGSPKPPPPAPFPPGRIPDHLRVPRTPSPETPPEVLEQYPAARPKRIARPKP
eukprot:3444551-Heterocapsa_arctica.AAC.1